MKKGVLVQNKISLITPLSGLSDNEIFFIYRFFVNFPVIFLLCFLNIFAKLDLALFNYYICMFCPHAIVNASIASSIAI